MLVERCHTVGVAYRQTRRDANRQPLLPPHPKGGIADIKRQNLPVWRSMCSLSPAVVSDLPRKHPQERYLVHNSMLNLMLRPSYSHARPGKAGVDVVKNAEAEPSEM